MWRHFVLPPFTTRGRRSSNVQLGYACARVPVYYLVSSVAVVGVGDRPPFSDLGCALRNSPALVLRSHPGVATVPPRGCRTKGLPMAKGGVVTSLCLICCGAPPQGMCKAPRDSGICWKQFTMRVGGYLVCGGISFYPHAPRGRRGSDVQLGSACAWCVLCAQYKSMRQ